MTKSYRFGYTLGLVLVIPFAFVYAMIRAMFPKQYNNEQGTNGDNIFTSLDGAWDIQFTESLEDYSHQELGELIASTLLLNFVTDDDGYLYVADYSTGEPIWKQVGMDD